MRKIVIKSGEYDIDGTWKMPFKDMVIVGESGAILVPRLGILPIQGIGDEELLCVKCNYILAKQIIRKNILVPIKCPSCGTLNFF